MTKIGTAQNGRRVAVAFPQIFTGAAGVVETEGGVQFAYRGPVPQRLPIIGTIDGQPYEATAAWLSVVGTRRINPATMTVVIARPVAAGATDGVAAAA